MSCISITNLLTIGYVISGTICLFGSKMQNIQWVNEGGVEKHFFHPYVQTFLQFVAEAFCLLFYFIMKRRNPQQYQQEEAKAKQQGREPVPKYLIVLPSLCDLLITCMQYMSLNFIPGSIYQMLKGIGIASTFGFSYLLTRKPVKRHQLYGAILAFIGVIIVGISALLFSQSIIYTTTDIIIGCSLMITGMTIRGFQFAYEARLMTKYYIQPMQLLGIEGVFGTVFSWVVVVIGMFVPCNFGQMACSYSKSGLPYMQRPDMYWNEVIHSPLLISMSIITMFSVAMFNLIGLEITKRVNALARAILNLAETALVWIIGLIVTATIGKYNQMYEWELLDWKDIVMEGTGFGLLILGTLVYNEVIKFKESNQHKQLVEDPDSKDT